MTRGASSPEQAQARVGPVSHVHRGQELGVRNQVSGPWSLFRTDHFPGKMRAVTPVLLILQDGEDRGNQARERKGGRELLPRERPTNCGRLGRTALSMGDRFFSLEMWLSGQGPAHPSV